MCLLMQFLFPNLVFAVLHHCMFESLMILNCKLLLMFDTKFLVAVLYHCMFKCVLLLVVAKVT